MYLIRHYTLNKHVILTFIKKKIKKIKKCYSHLVDVDLPLRGEGRPGGVDPVGDGVEYLGDVGLGVRHVGRRPPGHGGPQTVRDHTLLVRLYRQQVTAEGPELVNIKDTYYEQGRLYLSIFYETLL